MLIQHINPPELLSFDSLTQVVVTRGTKTVYIAGQSACNKVFQVVGLNDYRAQATQALLNLKAAVEAAGGSVNNIVNSTVYLKALTPVVVEQFMTAFATAIEGKPFPPHAFSIIGVTALSGADLLVEITAVAVLDV